MSSLKWQGDYVFGKYITFVHSSNSQTGKTMIWDVVSQDREKLGEIRWLGRWRQYSFFPYPDMVFEKTCLGQIQEFLIELMNLRKIKGNEH